jgi:hypothetical protein
LEHKLYKSKAILSAETIAQACFGLQGLEGNEESTGVLVQTLAGKLSKASATLKSEHVGRICAGLQNLNSSERRTSMLIEAITRLIASSFIEVYHAKDIGEVLHGIKALSEEHRLRILTAIGLSTPNMDLMRRLEVEGATEQDQQRLYSQYISYVLTTDPERGMRELEIFAFEGKIANLTKLEDTTFGEVDHEVVDCARHMPTTAAALVAYHLMKCQNSSTSRKSVCRVLVEDTGRVAIDGRIRRVVEDYLHQGGYKFVYSKGVITIQVK